MNESQTSKKLQNIFACMLKQTDGGYKIGEPQINAN